MSHDSEIVTTEEKIEFNKSGFNNDRTRLRFFLNQTNLERSTLKRLCYLGFFTCLSVQSETFLWIIKTNRKLGYYTCWSAESAPEDNKHDWLTKRDK